MPSFSSFPPPVLCNYLTKSSRPADSLENLIAAFARQSLVVEMILPLISKGEDCKHTSDPVFLVLLLHVELASMHLTASSASSAYEFCLAMERDFALQVTHFCSAGGHSLGCKYPDLGLNEKRSTALTPEQQLRL